MAVTNINIFFKIMYFWFLNRKRRFSVSVSEKFSGCVFFSKIVLTPLGLPKNVKKKCIFWSKTTPKIFKYFTWKSDYFCLICKSVNFAQIRVQIDSFEPAPNFLFGLQSSETWHQKIKNYGFQKGSTWESKIFFGPSSDFLLQKTKVVEKFM